MMRFVLLLVLNLVRYGNSVDSVGLGCILILLCVNSSAYSATFEALDFRPQDVSGNGQIVVGGSQRWSKFHGYLGGVGGGLRLVAVNADGTRILGRGVVSFPPCMSCPSVESYIWDSSDGIRASNLAQSGESSYGIGLSSNGEFASGYTYEGANTTNIFWNYETGAIEQSTSLPRSDGRSIALDVSNDGVFVGACCGQGEDYAFRWDAINGAEFLAQSQGSEASSRAVAISDDGEIIVGWVRDSWATYRRAVRWNEVGALETLLDFDSSISESSALGVSGDGRTVVGRLVEDTTSAIGPRAFVWTAEGGLQILSALLTSLGVDIEGWQLIEARAVSADGTTVVGVGRNPSGETQGFVAVIPKPPAPLLARPTGALNSNAYIDATSDIFPRIATDDGGQWLTVWQSNNDLGGSIGSDVDILLARSSDDGATWTDPVALNKTAEDDSANDVEPVIIADAAGNWVAAWSSTEDLDGTVGGDRDILFSRSADAGMTWTNVGALNTNADTDSGSDERPFIATNGGIFLAAWQSNDGATGPDYDIWVAQSFTGGASWESPILLNSTGASDSADDLHPVLATDSAGNWLAVWQANEATLGGDGDLLVARSTDDGTTWTAPIPLNQNAATDTGFDAWPTITTDGAGAWVAAWESSEDLGGSLGMDRDLLFARSADNGTTWTPPQPLNGNAASDLGDDANPTLIAEPSGNWTAIWDSDASFGESIGDDFDIFVARSTDGGITWTPPSVLNTNAAGDVGGGHNPKIAINATGDRAIAVWHSDDDLGGAVGFDWDVFFTSIDRCTSAGALRPSTGQLAAFQTNWCEDWTGVSQPGDDLQGAVLTRADLSLGNLSGASLLNASLMEADFSGADLSDAVLTGALYDESTLFPSGNPYDMPPWNLDDGVSPWDTGMIPVPEPSVVWMLFVGSIGLAGLSVRRRGVK